MNGQVPKQRGREAGLAESAGLLAAGPLAAGPPSVRLADGVLPGATSPDGRIPEGMSTAAIPDGVPAETLGALLERGAGSGPGGRDLTGPGAVTGAGRKVREELAPRGLAPRGLAALEHDVAGFAVTVDDDLAEPLEPVDDDLAVDDDLMVDDLVPDDLVPDDLVPDDLVPDDDAAMDDAVTSGGLTMDGGPASAGDMVPAKATVPDREVEHGDGIALSGPAGSDKPARDRSATASPGRPQRSKSQASSSEAYGGGSEDPVHTYLKEIGKVPLLGGQLEVEMARRIEAGNEAAARLAAHRLAEVEVEAGSAIKGQLLSSDEEFAARRMVRGGEQAKEALIEANLRLVVSIAKRYRNRGVAFLDLIQEGNLGLMRAVDKFDYTKGFKFSTYATWWIRQAITRAIADQARTIRIPVHMVETINKVVWAQRQLLQELGREPTAEEVAQRVEFAIERVREIQRINQDTVSLEQPVGEEDDFSLSDLIEDRGAVVPDDAATRAMLDQAVKQVLAQLTDREQDMVRLRFGLDDGKLRTLEEVGKEFGVTRERVRQIESKTLAKLRRPDAAYLLRDYLEEA